MDVVGKEGTVSRGKKKPSTGGEKVCSWPKLWNDEDSRRRRWQALRCKSESDGRTKRSAVVKWGETTRRTRWVDSLGWTGHCGFKPQLGWGVAEWVKGVKLQLDTATDIFRERQRPGSYGKICGEEVDTGGGGFIPHSLSHFLRISLSGCCCCCCRCQCFLSSAILFHFWTWIWTNNEVDWIKGGSNTEPELTYLWVSPERCWWTTGLPREPQQSKRLLGWFETSHVPSKYEIHLFSVLCSTAQLCTTKFSLCMKVCCFLLRSILGDYLNLSNVCEYYCRLSGEWK